MACGKSFWYICLRILCPCRSIIIYCLAFDPDTNSNLRWKLTQVFRLRNRWETDSISLVGLVIFTKQKLVEVQNWSFTHRQDHWSWFVSARLVDLRIWPEETVVWKRQYSNIMCLLESDTFFPSSFEVSLQMRQKWNKHRRPQCEPKATNLFSIKVLLHL